MRTKLLSVLALAALLFASCNNDEQDLNSGSTELRVSSGVTTLLKSAANTQESTIANGETVSLWVDDATTTGAVYKANQLTANGSNGFSYGTAMYFPQTGNAVDIYAIHGKFSPAFASGDAFPSGAVSYSVESNQKVLGGTAFTNSDLLYAYSKNVSRNGNPTTASLTFYHMLSKLELAFKIGAGTPTLAASNAITLGSNNVIVDGEFTPSTTATMTSQADRAAMLTAGTSTATIQLGQLISPDFTAANVIYNEAILVPQDMSGKVLTFNLANGGQLKYTIPANTTFESGKKYRYELTLNLTGLQVTSSIAEWDPVAAVQGNAEMD